jgi:mannitol-specific phosphotransferase system IIBC component
MRTATLFGSSYRFYRIDKLTDDKEEQGSSIVVNVFETAFLDLIAGIIEYDRIITNVRIILDSISKCMAHSRMSMCSLSSYLR